MTTTASQIQVDEEQLNFPEDDVSNVSSLQSPYEHSEPERRMWRGVFSPARHRWVLLSQRLKIRTDELPRLKPHITIDRRTLARAERHPTC